MIYGQRVRQAREIRRLTQPELAQAVGISQAAVSKIESSQLQPANDTVLALAFATGFPPPFFHWAPADDLPLGSLLYRAQTSLSASNRDRAHEWTRLLWDTVGALATRLELIPVGLPRLQGEDPVAAARLTRSELGIGPHEPIPHLINALERNGVLVLALPETMEGLDAFSVWAGSQDQVPLVVISPKAAGDRQRLSVAHEAGHLVLHRPPVVGIKQAELEAAAFAAELLMPADALRREIQIPVTLTQLAPLKPRWRVSIQALVRRSYDLDLISERHYRDLFKQVTIRGWRISEPANLAVELERPRGFRKMLEIIYGRPIDLQRFIADIPVSLSEAREMVHPHADLAELPFPSAKRSASTSDLVHFPNVQSKKARSIE